MQKSHYDSYDMMDHTELVVHKVRSQVDKLHYAPVQILERMKESHSGR